jgi:hypothetical protein
MTLLEGISPQVKVFLRGYNVKDVIVQCLGVGPHLGPHDGQKRSQSRSLLFGNIRYLHWVFIGNKPVSFGIHRSRPGASNGYGSKILIKKVFIIPEMRTYSYRGSRHRKGLPFRSPIPHRLERIGMLIYESTKQGFLETDLNTKEIGRFFILRNIVIQMKSSMK